MIQYNNFLMKREQSRAGSRFAECEKSRLKAKILITLALLLTAVTGAWADGKVYTSAVDITALQVGDILAEGASINGSGSIIFDNNRVKVNGTLQTEGFCYLYTDDFDSFGAEGVISLSNNTTMSPVDKDNNDGNAWEVTQVSFAENNNRINIQGITYAPAPIVVEPVEGKTNEWTFIQPGSDVVLTPIYAPTAEFNLSAGSSDKLPAAVEGIFIGSTNAIITEGVCAQGSLMYAVSTSATEAPSEFSSVVPTAENILTPGTYYVWYFIAGADTPQGQTPTAENTFNDSEICTKPIEVNIISDKFDIQFNAANANTIEAGKATVTVDGQSATLTDGKLQGVKMDSKVTITAATGYKFRKAVGKKGIVALKTLNVGGDCPGTITYAEGETWGQAIQNHPTENTGWEIGSSGSILYNYYGVWLGSGRVKKEDAITPGLGYYTE